ncbi:MAG: cyanophycin synthetase [Kyrpidia tusciae]|nr:cyanophycin synthetase [Kyrpidia tusciae]MBE3552162.1 cyanophycin synthetase [Kyrpidia tusciae]
MKILDVRFIPGPNIYVSKPILVARVDLEELTERESNEFPGFVDRLIEHLPGVTDHHCAKGMPGGFVERLREGTYFGHVLEHVTLELTDRIDAPAYFGKTLYAGRAGLYDVVMECHAPEAMTRLIAVAADLIQALVDGRPVSLDAALQEAADIHRRHRLGPSTAAIVREAEARGIPWRRILGGSFVQLGTGKWAKRIEATIGPETSAVAVDIACNKAYTKAVLKEAGVPVPDGGTALSEEEAARIARDVGLPVTVKPVHGNQGRGVSVRVNTEGEVREAYRRAAEIDPEVIVEQWVPGSQYRILVVRGRMVAASLRHPPRVVGDGMHQVRELIELENMDPRRGVGHEKPLTRIPIDEVVLRQLRAQGLDLEEVPAAGRVVVLRDSANLSTGGTAEDVSDRVHPDQRWLCERAARAVGLDICGVDLMTPDIARPVNEVGAVVLEVNAAPGIRMHEFPSKGAARNAGRAIVDALFPPGHPTRVPVYAVTGTNGKTTTTRMIAHILQSCGETVGAATTDGIYIGGRKIVEGDTTGPSSARTVLAHPDVTAVVLETARGGIIRGGLGYDWADVAVLTNISLDHIGQDQIETLEDLIFVKSLVAERVYPGGAVVLNADDPCLVDLAGRLRRRIVFFSMRPDNPVVLRHLAIGGTTILAKDGWILERTGARTWPIVRVVAVPVACRGAAGFHVANALAAAAACRAGGIPRSQIAHALRRFGREVDNPGRTNLYRVGRSYVMVDYGHNPHSFAAVGQLVQQWPGPRVTGVIGVPGDRDDSIIRAAGREAARHFQRIWVKEDRDTRGRDRGEVAGLLTEAVRGVNPLLPLYVNLEETAALGEAVSSSLPGELVVVFYEKKGPILQTLEELGAERVWDWPRASDRSQNAREVGHLWQTTLQ